MSKSLPDWDIAAFEEPPKISAVAPSETRAEGIFTVFPVTGLTNMA